jgi:hypothetical protein
MDVEVKNMSKSPIYVKDIRGTAWMIDEPSKISDKITFFEDVLKLTANAPRSVLGEGHGKRSFDKQFHYGNGPLVQLYEPGQSSHHTFEWIVPIEEHKLAVFLIEAFGSQENQISLDDQKPLDTTKQWDLVCGEDTK